MATKSKTEQIAAEEEDTASAEAAAVEAEVEEEEEAAASTADLAEEDPDAEDEAVDESLFAALPVLPKGKYEMELTKTAPRTATADDRPGYRSGIEFTFEPDRSEFPDAPKIKETVWASFYDDDKPGFKDMNRRAVKRFREAGLFPEQVILSGKPGTAKKVKYDYDEKVGGMYQVGVGVEDYQGEQSNRINALKAM